jgi:signal transduction histidine kinase
MPTKILVVDDEPDLELLIRKKDATVLDCLISARLRRSPDGQILGYQGIIHDITEGLHAERAREDRLAQEVAARTQEIQAQNAQLEDALRQVRDMQDQLITQQKLASLGALTAGIAHEIRNPLNFVNNFADLSVELAQELRDLLTDAQDHFDAKTFEDLEDMLVTIEQNMQKISSMAGAPIALSMACCSIPGGSQGCAPRRNSTSCWRSLWGWPITVCGRRMPRST